jgi:hypothetical protein
METHAGGTSNGCAARAAVRDRRTVVEGSEAADSTPMALLVETNGGLQPRDVFSVCERHNCVTREAQRAAHSHPHNPRTQRRSRCFLAASSSV